MKKLKPDLFVSYDFLPGNGNGSVLTASGLTRSRLGLLANGLSLASRLPYEAYSSMSSNVREAGNNVRENVCNNSKNV